MQAYVTDWAHYRASPYKWSPSDYAGIAKRTDVALYSFIYFCPPAGTSPMPYWASAPYVDELRVCGVPVCPLSPSCSPSWLLPRVPSDNVCMCWLWVPTLPVSFSSAGLQVSLFVGEGTGRASVTMEL